HYPFPCQWPGSRIGVIIACRISGEVDKLRIGAHRAGGRIAVLQGEIAVAGVVATGVLVKEVVRVNVVGACGPLLEDATGVVEGDVVVHNCVVVDHPARAHHDAAGEVAEERVVDENFVGGAVPELNAPAGIVEGKVVPDHGAGTRVARAGGVNPVNVAARGRVGTVVVHIVADHLGVGGVHVDAGASRHIAAIRALRVVDVVADDPGRVARGVDALAAARLRPGHVEVLNLNVRPVVGPGRERSANDFGAPLRIGDIGDVRRGGAGSVGVERPGVG